MAEKTLTVFICDWCGATTPGIERGYSGAALPDGWEQAHACSDCGTSDLLLCAECAGARTKALGDVESQRRASR
jgi:hypothetical protein